MLLIINLELNYFAKRIGQNILITDKAKSRLIDFGLAEFIGIKGHISTKNNFAGTNCYIAPDSGVTKYLYYKLEKYKLPDYNRNYSSDIFSLGNIIMYSIFNCSYSLFFSNENIYYYLHTINVPKINLTILNEEMINKINHISPYLLDLLKHIFDVNSKTRYTAKEVLEHPLFKERISDICICSADKDNTIIRSISEIENPLYSSDDVRFQRGELKYGKEISDFYFESKIPATIIDDSVFDIVSNFYSTNDIKSMDFDIIFNMNIILTSFYNSADDSILRIMFNKRSYNGNIYTNDIIRSLSTAFDNFYPISITSVIEYYVTMLQFHGYPSTIITFFKLTAYKEAYDYSVSERKIEITVESFMKAILSDISDTKDILMPIF